MSPTLETLELSPEELELSKEAVRKIAYFKWLDAGQPEGELEFWLQAEQEWIEHNYVPHRTLDGTRPDPTDKPRRSAARAKQGESSRSREPRTGGAKLIAQ
ncbi:MAG TPA: DUF2934 domain-containing protein [Candidatus Binatia bacterium]|nr:DUF2934 domain-containing protein [Candidatus Binatia bacterium]